MSVWKADLSIITDIMLEAAAILKVDWRPLNPLGSSQQQTPRSTG
ncbi:MAG: hypothetical protein AB7U20_18620 [Planctomycetaceae bacterium]